MKKLYLFLMAFSLACGGFAQIGGPNNTCEQAAPFCTGTTYTFPAGVNAGSGQPGPYYACLQTRPNPAWYYLKVLNPGLIQIHMYTEPSRDIDFCCWGPFDSQDCCDQLTQPKVVDCSYSPLPQETCDIPNAQTGKYYMLVITNFSNQPCNIIFSQTGGNGSTDCSILPPPCSNNSPICAGQTLQLNANTVTNATYHWSGPNGFQSNLQNPTIPNAQPVNSGDYYVNIMVNGQPSQDSSVTHAYVYKPVANAGNDTTITNGVFTTLHGSATGGSGSYNYSWADPAFLVDPNVQNPVTINLFAARVFTLTVTDDSAACVDEDDVLINIAGGPLAVGATASPSAICFGATTTLNAVGSGGTGTYTFSWTGPNGFTSTLQNPVVQPGVTSTYSVTINDGYNNTSSDVTVTVHPLPLADAGTDKSIPNGTYIYLSGSGSGGSGNYSYAWTPVDKLLNAYVAAPRTINLSATTIYSLVITDNTTGCISNNTANVTVEVTGGPLAVAPVATPDSICTGSSTQIHASAGGGNAGYYTYSWTSVPPGFTSTEPDPMVSPVVNTTYIVSVNDAFNTVTGSVPVIIYPQPQIHLGPPDSTVCVYATVVLDAGNPGSQYLWSNGETTRTVQLNATGISTELQTLSVQVTNVYGCMSESLINVLFDFSACVGIDESDALHGLRIYPNPSSGLINVEAEGSKRDLNIVIQSVYGQEIARYVLPAALSGKSNMTLDLSVLAKGMYFIMIEGDRIIKTEKLILR